MASAIRSPRTQTFGCTEHRCREQLEPASKVDLGGLSAETTKSFDKILAGEYDARASYKKSRDICYEQGDYVSMKLFEELLADDDASLPRR